MKSLKILYSILAGSAILLALAVYTATPTAAQQSEESSESVATEKDERFFMLNAIWFKPEGGAEKYNEYLQAAGPFVAQYGGKSHGTYAPEAAIIGKFDADLVFFVEWPNDKAFADFVQDKGYRAVSHLREEAIRDSLLIRCRRVGG